jgi:hypothetical protein
VSPGHRTTGCAPRLAACAPAVARSCGARFPEEAHTQHFCTAGRPGFSRKTPKQIRRTWLTSCAVAQGCSGSRGTAPICNRAVAVAAPCRPSLSETSETFDASRASRFAPFFGDARPEKCAIRSVDSVIVTLGAQDTGGRPGQHTLAPYHRIRATKRARDAAEPQRAMRKLQGTA